MDAHFILVIVILARCVSKGKTENECEMSNASNTGWKEAIMRNRVLKVKAFVAPSCPQILTTKNTVWKT